VEGCEEDSGGNDIAALAAEAAAALFKEPELPGSNNEFRALAE
jgi:hypothetical protein